MATVEERLTLLEREQTALKNNNTELKKTIELQTIAIGALVNKAALERLNERYDKLFERLIAHDEFTNHQLAELRGQQTELDGKIVGMQTEMRQGFNAVNARFEAVNARLETVATKDDLKAIDARFDQIMSLLTALAPKPDQEA